MVKRHYKLFRNGRLIPFYKNRSFASLENAKKFVETRQSKDSIDIKKVR